MKKNLIKILVTVLAITLLATACSSKPEGAVAKVGNEYIKEEDVNKILDQYKKMYGESIFDEKTAQGKEALAKIRPGIIEMLVNDKVTGKLIKDNKITASPEDIDKQLQSIKTQLGEAKYKEQLTANKITEEKLKEQLKTQIERTKLSESLAKKFEPKPEQIKEYFDKHKAEFVVYNASHILISTKDSKQANLDKAATEKKLQDAKAIVAKIKGGEDFAKIATEVSEDPGSKPKGGELGDFIGSTMVKEFADALAKMKIGDISDPVKSEYGYHIIKLNAKYEELDKMPAAIKTQIETKIKQTLVKEKTDELYKTEQKSLGVKIY